MNGEVKFFVKIQKKKFMGGGGGGGRVGEVRGRCELRSGEVFV